MTAATREGSVGGLMTTKCTIRLYESLCASVESSIFEGGKGVRWIVYIYLFIHPPPILDRWLEVVWRGRL